VKHIMLDLETMGVEPGAPVVAIGAVRFEMNDDSPIVDFFHQAISLKSCMEYGMIPEADAITWWLTSPEIAPEARSMFRLEAGMDIVPALSGFSNWYCEEPCRLWGNSAAFDCGLLAAAYQAAGMKKPWAFGQERCYRTVKNLPKAADVKLDRVGTHHKAVDDAASQAIHLRNIWKVLGLS
jgi:hypothetical protein